MNPEPWTSVSGMRAERFRGSWPVRLWVVVGLAAVAAVGCTDEPRQDRGRGDAATDAGEDPDLLPRRDGGVVEGDPIPFCEDRYSPTACPAGMECDVIVTRPAGSADDVQFGITLGCIDTGDERLEGEPCVPWGGFATPIEAEGLTDEAYNDPCGPGLFCAPDPRVRGLNTCQQSCDTPGGPFPPRGCDSDAEYCSGRDWLQEVCVPGEDCDPRDPGACGAGMGCYVRFNHNESAALTVCLPVLPPPDPLLPTQPYALEDGAKCTYINHCKAGASCWGPTTVLHSAWTAEDLLCRRSCEVSEGDADAGTDDDAGASGPGDEDSCEGALTCVDLHDAVSVSYDEISVVFGQCE